MENRRPLILISNDDGYHARGLQCLIEMLRDKADLLVCAPESARSGFSCAFSATSPLTLKLRRQADGVEVWSCSGTPVDCVKMALSELCGYRGTDDRHFMSRLSDGRWPDVVIGGINHGDNASVNTHYSGTMGVTMEGCMKGIPSVAFSLCDHRDEADFSPLDKIVRIITQRVLDEGLPKGICLNVNFPVVVRDDENPYGGYAGVKACRMAWGIWTKETVRCLHPRGYDYYWMVGEYQDEESGAEDTDRWALAHGFVSVTPTKVDVTGYEMLRQIKDWNL